MAVVVGEAAVRLRPDTDGFEDEAEGGILPAMGKIGAGAAAAFGGALALGSVFSSALDAGELQSKFAAQLGLTVPEAARAGQVAGDIYSGNFGDSLEQVYDASKLVTQNMGIALDDVSFQGVTENVLALSSTMDQDLGATTRAVGQLMRTGLAGNAQEALDIVASGFQNGADKSEDFLDTLNEYGTQFRNIGLDGATATGLLSQGLQAGARDSDIVADSLKEFGLQVGQASDQARTGYEAIGLNADDMFAKFSQGGPAATGALQETLDALRAMPPGFERNTAAAALFGTQAEDMGEALYALDPASAALDDVAGAADRLAATSGANLKSVLTGIGRTIQTDVVGSLDSLIRGFMTGTTSLDGFQGTMESTGAAISSYVGDALAVWDEFTAKFGAAAMPGLSELGGAFAATFGAIRDAVAPLMSSIGEGISGAGGGLAAALGGALSQAASALAPVISSIAGSIGPLIAQIGPAIGQLLPIVFAVAGVWRDVFLSAFEALAPVLPVIVGAIGQLVSTLGTALGPVLAMLAPIIGQVASTLGTTLGSAIAALAPVIPTIVDTLGQLASIIAGALGQALGLILPILPQLADLFGQVATMLANALGGVISAILPILPPLVSALMQIATSLIGALMPALSAIMPVIPQLVSVFVLLIQSAITPLLPILPILANLLATIIAAVAPLIPVVVQVVAMLIQLAIAAIMPLMPIIMIAVNLFSMLIQAIIPIVQVVITVAGAFIGFAASVIGTVVGFVSTVAGVFSGLIGTITSIFGSIFGVIRGVWSSIFGFISGIVSSIAGTISGVFSGVIGAIGNMFGGIGRVVSGAFDTAVGAVKGAINAVIGIINGAIGFINDKLIDNANKVPFVNIPHIPNVPRLHEGGVFDSNAPAGEGLALLRDDELVITPEQRRIADDLLRDLFAGRTPAGADTATTTTGQPVQIVNNVTQQPGEDPGALAARVTQGVVWNLNAGITRRVGVAAEVTT